MRENSHLNTIIGELLENNGKFCSSKDASEDMVQRWNIYL
jgi:hypothetical protein